MNRVQHCGLWLAVLLVGLAWTALATAQHAAVDGSAPPPPSGNGVLTVRIVDPTQAGDIAGLPIALYALSPDGTPGYAGGETNAQGIFEFAGISTDPGIVYLVGVHYHEIPFGERMTFEGGRSEAVVEIEVTEPSQQTGEVRVDELRVRIDWMGDQILLQEVLSLSNGSDRVIQLPPDSSGDSIATRPIDSKASQFSPGARSIGDAITLESGKIRFRGPLYPGDQKVEYRYSLPVVTEGRSLSVPIELDRAAGRVVVVAGTSGIEVEGAELVPSSEVQSDTGKRLNTWARAGLEAGEVLELAVTLPDSRLDASLLKVPRSDIWLEIDDTRMTARVDIQVVVEPGAPVAGTPDAPLLRVTIPEGATLQGVAPEAEALGLIPQDHGGFDVIGPIGAGTTSIGYSYHLPTGPRGFDLGMRFPLDVETLNVLIADTGLALDSGRLHRRRPFREGTRNYLHREAFNVAADETVDLRLEPLRATGLSQNGSLAVTIAAAVVGAFFLFAPLRTVSRREVRDDSPESRIQAERETIYTAISDLDHDFETAKLEEGDYTEMRDGLRAQAIELLRRERDVGRVDATPATDVDAGRTHGLAIANASAAAAAEPSTGEYCPHCGQTVTPSWRFCSHCGGDLNPPSEASA